MATRPKIPDKPKADFCEPPPPAVVGALKAMYAGTGADPHQQKLALMWIVNKAGGKGTFPYHETERDTAFALGRVFVADLILGLLKFDRSG